MFNFLKKFQTTETSEKDILISNTTKNNSREKDYSLNSGERQVGRKLDDIRKDHLNRYAMILNYCQNTKNNINIADVFCGNGYGTYMMSSTFENAFVIGIDGSKEAIDLANECYSLENNCFTKKLFPFSLPLNTFDVITCFESLEHVDNDNQMLSNIFNSLKNNGLAFISVPNQEIHPLEKNPHHFHFRHYNHDDFLKKIPQDVELKKWFGQNVYKFENGVNTFQLLPTDEMCLTENTHGQVNIYIFRKK